LMLLFLLLFGGGGGDGFVVWEIARQALYH
jgi:hypothetical protein